MGDKTLLQKDRESDAGIPNASVVFSSVNAYPTVISFSLCTLAGGVSLSHTDYKHFLHDSGQSYKISAVIQLKIRSDSMG